MITPPKLHHAMGHDPGRLLIAVEILISGQPAEVADRSVPDRWEDLILGLDDFAIGALVERTTSGKSSKVS